MIIREAGIADANAIAMVNMNAKRAANKEITTEKRLNNVSFQNKGKFYLDFIKNKDKKTFIYVAQEDNGDIVGFAAAGPERSGNINYKGEIYAIYIDKGYQGKGLGRFLTKAAVKRLGQQDTWSMLVWVLADNPNRKFYESLGGQQVEVRFANSEQESLYMVAYGWPDTRQILYDW